MHAGALRVEQVLSNPELRERYDHHGSEGLDVNFMDGGEFFNMLFGSDLFEHLVGELAIAQAARSGGDMTHAQMKVIIPWACRGLGWLGRQGQGARAGRPQRVEERSLGHARRGVDVALGAPG